MNRKKKNIWKLEPWLSSLKGSLGELVQEEYSSVDEGMVPFNGALSCGGIQGVQVLYMSLKYIMEQKLKHRNNHRLLPQN